MLGILWGAGMIILATASYCAIIEDEKLLGKESVLMFPTADVSKNLWLLTPAFTSTVVQIEKYRLCPCRFSFKHSRSWGMMSPIQTRLAQ
jgi:hypothetical protein